MSEAVKSLPPVSTHSRPKAAEFTHHINHLCIIGVSTHSRPKAAERTIWARCAGANVSTHSRPKAAEPNTSTLGWAFRRFQHTAARRRLNLIKDDGVSF